MGCGTMGDGAVSPRISLTALGTRPIGIAGSAVTQEFYTAVIPSAPEWQL